jgi:thioesterase domain-containing protein
MTEAQALAFIEQYLQQHLPLTVAMQVQAVAYDGQTLRLNAPLAVNHNDKGTAFAGSLSSLATVCGWCLVMVWVKQHYQQPCQVAVAQAQIDYKKPTNSDFYALAHLPDTHSLHQALQMLARKGRTRLTINIEVCDEQGVTVTQIASYAIWRV